MKNKWKFLRGDLLSRIISYYACSSNNRRLHDICYAL